MYQKTTKQNKQGRLQDECDQTKDENMKPKARYVTIFLQTRQLTK